jgi:hypothetical protein
MIAALLLGRAGSVGFPGKNLIEVLGRPLMEYPLLAALHSKEIDEVYVSTDSDDIKSIARKHGAFVIDRPSYLCTKDALGEDAYAHGYQHIKSLGKDIEFMGLLFCNAPCVLPKYVTEGVSALRTDHMLDSAVTVSCYNMYSPVRARNIGSDGLLHPFIPFENYPAGMVISCDRDAQGYVYFADVCLSIVRPRCLEDLNYGVLPQKWMGQKIYPIKQWGGLDVDYQWQLPLVEYWLKAHKFTEEALPYDK